MKKSILLFVLVIFSCKSSKIIGPSAENDTIWVTGLLVKKNGDFHILIDQVYLLKSSLSSYDNFQWMDDSTKMANKFQIIQESQTDMLGKFFQCKKLILNEFVKLQSDPEFMTYLMQDSISDRVLLIGSPAQEEPKVFEASYIAPLTKHLQKKLLKYYWPSTSYTLEVYSNYH
jgi:hypothetical protein